jgi:hypothetical protein
MAKLTTDLRAVSMGRIEHILGQIRVRGVVEGDEYTSLRAIVYECQSGGLLDIDEAATLFLQFERTQEAMRSLADARNAVWEVTRA